MVEIGSRGEPEPDALVAPGDPRVAPDETAEVLGTGSASGPRWRLPVMAPVYGWGLAAALALGAPFAAINTLEVQLPNGRVRVATIDGWGSDHPHQALQVAHDVRFGIALWACALGLLAAGVLASLALRRADEVVPRRRAMLAAIAAPSALAGVVASVVLSAQTFVDRFEALSAVREPALTAGEAVYQASFGTCVWLSVAALVLAVLSSFAFLRGLLLKPLGDGARLDPAGT